MSERLDELRQRLDSLDSRILDLLLERNRVAQEVVETKIAQAMPIYVPEREVEKVERFRKAAEDRGLDAQWAEDFLRLIFGASRAAQSGGEAPRATADARKWLIVGGEGAMASLYGRFAKASGHEVVTLDQEDWPRLDELAAGADLVLVAVPIRATLEVVEKIAPALPETAILADFTSTKSKVLERMLALHSGPVVGLHPMHGPDVPNLSKQLMVVCDGRDRESYAWFLQQLVLWGMVLRTVDPERHDRAMHVIQGMRHFVALVHGSFLRSSGLSPEEILSFSSPIYRAELMMVGRIFAQDPELYADIVFSDDDRRALLERFFAHHGSLMRYVFKDDKKGFEAEFADVGEYFGEFAEQALEESGYLIHRLAERFG